MTPLILGLALVVGAPGLKEPPKKDPPGPVGRWAVESITVAGMALPKMDLTITFLADGRFETRDAGGGTKTSGTYTADPKKQPAELDVTEPAAPDGKASLSIYRVDGDTLTICTAIMGERPTAFDPKPGANQLLLVLKRIKD